MDFILSVENAEYLEKMEEIYNQTNVQSYLGILFSLSTSIGKKFVIDLYFDGVGLLILTDISYMQDKDSPQIIIGFREKNWSIIKIIHIKKLTDIIGTVNLNGFRAFKLFIYKYILTNKGESRPFIITPNSNLISVYSDC